MNTLSAKTIALSRVSYGESDRIVTFITEDGSKITLLTKGVRKIKSKLAGGIELFCVSDLVYINSKNKLGTLISARVHNNYPNIVKDIDRTMFGYDVLKLVNKITEDNQLVEYFKLLNKTLESLNDLSMDLDLIKTWSYFKLIEFSGHAPNVQTDNQGMKLVEGKRYAVDFSNMSFYPDQQGKVSTDQIKLLRTMPRLSSPSRLQAVNNISHIKQGLDSILVKMINYNL